MTIGQKIHHQRAMIVIVDYSGGVHAWDVGEGDSAWDWTGVDSSGASTARVTMNGSLHRRTRDIQQFINDNMGEITDGGT